jgi:hypothetical protein
MQCVPDLFCYPFNAVEHLVVPETKYSVAGTLQRFGSCGVSPLSIFVSVGIAIELDYKSRAQTYEVSDVIADGMLPPKLEAVQLPAA